MNKDHELLEDAYLENPLTELFYFIAVNALCVGARYALDYVGIDSNTDPEAYEGAMGEALNLNRGEFYLYVTNGLTEFLKYASERLVSAGYLREPEALDDLMLALFDIYPGDDEEEE